MSCSLVLSSLGCHLPWKGGIILGEMALFRVIPKEQPGNKYFSPEGEICMMQHSIHDKVLNKEIFFELLKEFNVLISSTGKFLPQLKDLTSLVTMTTHINTLNLSLSANAFISNYRNENCNSYVLSEVISLGNSFGKE